MIQSKKKFIQIDDFCNYPIACLTNLQIDLRDNQIDDQGGLGIAQGLINCSQLIILRLFLT
ncbi:hypothetical protein ABPG73_022681, partial [Tetrahymena malaccensis]